MDVNDILAVFSPLLQPPAKLRRECLDQPRPEPGFHDIFGLVKIGRAEILGDILALVKNLRFFKEVMALPRETRT